MAAQPALNETNASGCPLRPDGRCEVTGLTPLLCPKHGPHAPQPRPEAPVPCPPCQQAREEYENLYG